METRPLSAFARFSEWLAGLMAAGGAITTTIAIISVPLGFAYSVTLYASAGMMFIIGQIFIIRWMFGTGMRSIKELGFGSNRQAFKYGFYMRGMDSRLLVVALYSLIASIVIGWAEHGEVVSGAMLLTFTTFAAATQAMRLNRHWPENAERPEVS